MKLILCIFISLLTSCMGQSSLSVKNMFRPGGKVFTHMPKKNTPAYKKGWTDGCESGMSIFGHTFHKGFYSFTKDWRFTAGYKYGDKRDLFEGKDITDRDKKEYSVAWGGAYSFCKHYVLATQKGGAGMMPHIPGMDGVGKLHGTYHVYDIQAWGPNTTDGLIANW
jgi:hypothetical protein